MSARPVMLGMPIARFSGPPKGRMNGRPSSMRAARAAATPSVSAATEAKAQAYLDREQLLDQAMHAAVIGGGLRAHYAACYEADPEGTRRYLGAIDATRAATDADGYDESALSQQERERIHAARQGKRPRVGGEGA